MWGRGVYLDVSLTYGKSRLIGEGVWPDGMCRLGPRGGAFDLGGLLTRLFNKWGASDRGAFDRTPYTISFPISRYALAPSPWVGLFICILLYASLFNYLSHIFCSVLCDRLSWLTVNFRVYMYPQKIHLFMCYDLGCDILHLKTARSSLPSLRRTNQIH